MLQVMDGAQQVSVVFAVIEMWGQWVVFYCQANVGGVSGLFLLLLLSVKCGLGQWSVFVVSQMNRG